MAIPCVILGDSIAVGLAQAAPQCERHAAVGLSAAAFVQRFSCHRGDTAIISLGSNPGPADETYLRFVRRCQTGRVVWMLPPARAREVVARVASEFGDAVVDVRDAGAGPAHTHPSARGYAELAKEALSHG